MTTSSEHSAGDFCWMDLNTADPAAAGNFYRELFGWQMGPWPAGDEAEREAVGGYRQITYRGKVLGGAMKLPGDDAMPVWNVFFAVDDADRATERIEAGGGRVLVAPTPVPGGSRVAFFADPAGAFCGIQELSQGGGLECAMQPNTVHWLEAGSRSPDVTRAFYTDVFGWSFQTPAPGEAADGYTLIHNGDRNFGGMMAMDGRFPESIGSYWMIYIGVENLKSTLSDVERLGGHVGFGPIDVPDGKVAVVSDPQGAHFAVIQPSAEAVARTGN